MVHSSALAQKPPHSPAETKGGSLLKAKVFQLPVIVIVMDSLADSI